MGRFYQVSQETGDSCTDVAEQVPQTHSREMNGSEEFRRMTHSHLEKVTVGTANPGCRFRHSKHCVR
jgi:hypothetical protein